MSEPGAGKQRVIFITGTSSGIGQACARRLARRTDWRVFGSSRGVSEPTPTDGHLMLPLDVTDGTAVDQAINHILEMAGRIDVLVNNAGFALAGAVEELPLDAVRRQMETNFVGTLRLCQAVLPAMRRQGSGLIVNMSSLGGLVGMPFQSLYSASKFAVEGMSEALALEVRPFGIRVALVEPGDVRTALTDHRQAVAPEPGSPYAAAYDATLQKVIQDERGGADPDDVALLLERLVDRPMASLRHRTGPWSSRLLIRLRDLLPGDLTQRLLADHFNLPD